jgi:hypothetical protein
MLDENEIAFLETLAAGELFAGLGDIADILVAHDRGLVIWRMRVKLDVSAADAGHFNLEQGGVVRDVRHGKFPDLGLARTGTHCRQYFLCH